MLFWGGVQHFTGDPSILGDHLNYFSAASAGAALTLLDTEVYKRHAFTVPPTVQTRQSLLFLLRGTDLVTG